MKMVTRVIVTRRRWFRQRAEVSLRSSWTWRWRRSMSLCRHSIGHTVDRSQNRVFVVRPVIFVNLKIYLAGARLARGNALAVHVNRQLELSKRLGHRLKRRTQILRSEVLCTRLCERRLRISVRISWLGILRIETRPNIVSVDGGIVATPGILKVGQ